MDLAELKFVVDTKQLEDAAKKIEALGTAVTELNAVQKQSASTNRDEAKASKEKAQADTAQVQAKDKLTEATEKSTKASRAAVSETDRLSKLTTNLENTFKDLSKGFTRGESSVLNLARGFGATTTEIERVKAELAKIGTLIKDPFDAAIGSVRSINQEFDKVTNRTNLAAQGIVLTTKQLSEYSRVATEISAKILSAGLDPTSGKGLADFTKGLDRVQQKYLGIAESVNIANNAEKERQRIAKEAQGPTSGSMDQAVGMYYKEQARAMRESSSAAAYLEKEMKRVDFVLSEVNAELQLSTSNRLLKFEESLKRTGVTGTQAATKIEAYRQSLQKIDETRAFKRQTDDLKVYQDKVNYVTRAVGPQLTDIFSGLLTGQQSLYTIAVQQGGQLADQFSLAGIEANKMGGILASALPNMLTNITNIGKAFGQMAVGGITQLGTSITNLAASALLPTKNLQQLRNEMIALDGIANSSSLRLRAFDAALKFTSVSAGLVVASIAASFVALAVASYQVVKEETALSKALNTTGASLGLTKNSAVAYATSMNDLGISTSKGIEVISEMSKSGVLGSDAIRMITQSAVEMEKYAGVAIADTVKAFESMKEKPVESLVALAKATGMVAPETIKLVYELENQGRTAEAASIAMNALADANSASAKRIQDDLHPLQQLWISLGNGISAIWNGVKDLTRNDSTAALGKAYERLASYQINPNAHKANIEAERILISQLSSKIRLEATGVKLRQDQAVAAGNTAKWEEIKIQNLSKEKKEAQEILKVRESGAKVGASEAEIQQQISAIIAKRPKPPKVPESEYSKTMKKATEEYIDIQNKANGVNTQFNNQLDRQKFLLQEGKITTEEYAQVIIALTQQQKVYTDEVTKQEKAQRELNKAWDDAIKAQAKKDDDFFKQFDEMTKQRQELEMQTSEIEFQLTLVGKTADEQKAMTREFQLQNKLKNVQVELEQELQKIAAEKKDPADVLMFNQEAHRQSAEKIKAINAGVALEFALDMQREFDSIKATITDAVVTALFDGGKAGSKKLRDSIVAAFRNRITVVIDAVVNTVLGSVIGGVANASGLSGATSSAGGIGGIISAGKGIYDAISGGFSSLGASVTSQFSNFATSAIGQQMGLSTVQSGVNYGLTASSAYAAPSAQMTASAASMAKSAGTIASYAGAALAGIGIGSAIGGNKVVVGLDSKSTSAIGAAVGSIFGPVGTFVGGVLGGVVSAAFGMGPKQTNASGISGTFGASTGANVQQYSQWSQKGGWFRSDKSGVDYSAIAKDAQDYLNLGVTAITAQTKAYADALGLNADSIAGFTKSINISLMGLDAEGQQKAIDNAIVGFGSSMAETLLGTFETTTTQLYSRLFRKRLSGRTVTTTTWKPGPFVKEGETAGQALQRLATSLVLVNSTFDTLEVTLLQVSLTSANAASTLIDAFGGVEAYAASMQSYFSNFYSENEQIAKATENAGKAFAALGITMPAVNEEMRAWYRGVVEQALALDQGVVANAQATAAILGLQGMVNDLAPSMSDTANATSSLVDAMIASSKKLQDAINETRRTQMQPAELVKNQQYEFDRTYALALSTTGETRIGYADELAAILPDLSEAIKATSSSSAEWMARTAAAFGQAQNLANLMGTGGTTVASISSVGSTAAPISTATAPGATSIVFDNSAVVLAVDRLNANIDLLRMEVQADVMHNAKTAKLLDRVIPDGESVQVTVLV